jgi:hypothetical protein
VKPRSTTTARLPDFVEPMKAKLVASMRSGGEWIYEVKFDGYRALALRGGSETRTMLCRIPFYAAPSTESPLTRHSPMRHKKVLPRGVTPCRPSRRHTGI